MCGAVAALQQEPRHGADQPRDGDAQRFTTNVVAPALDSLFVSRTAASGTAAAETARSRQPSRSTPPTQSGTSPASSSFSSHGVDHNAHAPVAAVEVQGT